MGKQGKKTTTKRRPTPKKRKARPRVPTRKKKPRAKNNPKKKIRRRKKSASRRPANAKKSRKLRTKLSGNSSRIKVDSLYAGKNVTILRKTTKFSPPLKVARGKSGPWALRKVMKPSAERHFENIGASAKNLFYVRLQYIARLRGKKIVSHFSIGIAKLKSPAQFEQYLEDCIESFCSSLVGYSRDGFSQVRVTALIVQGYKK